MTILQSWLGRNTGNQNIRQSTALTTAYLLEMNRKFESFMQDKIEELESRVAAQQARLSTSSSTQEIPTEDAVDTSASSPTTRWDDIVSFTDIVPDCEEDSHDEVSAGEPESVEPDTPPDVPEDYVDFLLGGSTEAESAALPVSEDSEPDYSVSAGHDSVAGTAAGEEPVDAEEIWSGTESPLAEETQDDKIMETTESFETGELSELPVQPEQPEATLLTESEAETVPWFMSEDHLTSGARGEAASLLFSTEAAVESLGNDIVQVDTAPVENLEPDDLESDEVGGDWESDLPATGQKGRWA